MKHSTRKHILYIAAKLEKVFLWQNIFFLLKGIV